MVSRHLVAGFGLSVITVLAVVPTPPLAAQPPSKDASEDTAEVHRTLVDLGPAGRAAVDSLLAAEPSGFVGVQMMNLTPGLRGYFQVPEGLGVLIADVEADGPAAAAGLRAGDVIVSLADRPIRSSDQVADLVRGLPAGRTVDVGIIRDGRRQDTRVEVEERRRVVIRLSPSLLQQRLERSLEQQAAVGDGAAAATETEPALALRELDEGTLHLAIDQIEMFLSGDGLRHKIDQLEALDLGEVDRRIRDLERELTLLERQLPEQKEPPPDR